MVTLLLPGARILHGMFHRRQTVRRGHVMLCHALHVVCYVSVVPFMSHVYFMLSALAFKTHANQIQIRPTFPPAVCSTYVVVGSWELMLVPPSEVLARL